MTKSPTQSRAATYARFSTDKQSEVSIDDQRRSCAEYAKANNMVIVEQYSDLAISGAALGNRPGFQDLKRLAFGGQIDAILVAELARLSRSNADLNKFIEQLRFRNIRVIGVLDHFDSTQRHARMQAGLSGIMSDEYRAAIGERVHLALDSLARKGKPTGGVAYGYTSKRLIVPDQARVVKELFKRVARGESMKSVASDLNRRGIPSPGANWKRTTNRQDSRWIVPALHAMLRNEIYIGRVIWNRSQWVKDPDTGLRQRRKRPKEQWYIEERPALRLVDEKTWNAVQTRIEQRADACNHKAGRPARYPLSGILKCGQCGGSFIMAGGGNKNSHGYGTSGAKYYMCNTYHQGGPNACSNDLRVARLEVEKKLMEPALTELLSEAAVNTAIARIRRQLRERPPRTAPDLMDVEAKVAKLRAAVDAGTLDPDTAEPAFAKLEADRANIMRLAQLAVQRPLLSGPWGIEAEYRAQVEKLRADLSGENADAARAALKLVYGPTIRLIPEGDHLVAEIKLHADALASAVGLSTGRIQLISGGKI